MIIRLALSSLVGCVGTSDLAQMLEVFRRVGFPPLKLPEAVALRLWRQIGVPYAAGVCWISLKQRDVAMRRRRLTAVRRIGSALIYAAHH